MRLKNLSSSLELRAKTKNRNCVYVGLQIFGNIPSFPGGAVVKNPPANAGDAVRSLGGRSPGEGNGNPLQCSCLGNIPK